MSFLKAPLGKSQAICVSCVEKDAFGSSSARVPWDEEEENGPRQLLGLCARDGFTLNPSREPAQLVLSDWMDEGERL